MSIPPITAAKETPNFSNETIKKFNESIAAKAEEWGIIYLDFNSKFGDALKPDYARDGIHHPKAFQEVWIPFLQNVAAENL